MNPFFYSERENMNLIIASSVQTMTSREIAELVESRHVDVCRTIDRLMESGAISGYAPMAYTHPQNGQTYSEYHVGQRDSYVIVAQLSPQFTARLVDRWQELEQAAKPQLPQTFAQALRLAAEQAEVIERQQAQIEAARPAVEFKEKYVNSSTGTLGFREVCKMLKANERKFADFLKAEKIMYKLGREWTPYANHLDTGRFEVKTGTAEATGHAYNRSKFTPKGVAWVAGLWTAYLLETDTGKSVSPTKSANSQSLLAGGAA